MTEIILVRHGNALKAEGQPDSARQLSPVGKAQARARRQHLRSLFDFGKGLVVCSSPMNRAVSTVQIITDQTDDAIVRIPELSTPPGEEGAILEDLFDMLAYKPLADYFANAKYGVGKSQQVLENFGRNAWQKIIQLAEETEAQTLIVGGHAVYHPAIALMACEAWKTDQVRVARIRVLNWQMGEAGAVVLNVREGQAPHLHILPEVESCVV